MEQGYDAVGNRLWKRDNEKTDRSETYAYDQRDRLSDVERGMMSSDPNSPVIVTPSTDAEMPNRQSWADPNTGAPMAGQVRQLAQDGHPNEHEHGPADAGAGELDE